MNNLWILAGIPGAGKSTWARTHMDKISDDVKYVSRDEIRFSIVKEDEEYFSHENEVFNKFIEEIRDGLRNHKDTIADATHLSKASRNKLLNNIGLSLKNCKINIIVINTPLEIALERNEERKGTRSYVPRGAIRRMKSQYEIPSIEEGFDKVIFYDEANPFVHYIIIERNN
jgi:predicted kinase